MKNLTCQQCGKLFGTFTFTADHNKAQLVLYAFCSRMCRMKWEARVGIPVGTFESQEDVPHE